MAKTEQDRRGQRLRSLPIRFQFLALTSLSLLIPFLGFGLFYGRVATVMIARSERYNEQIFAQVSRNVESTCDVFARLFKTVAYNPLVQEFMLADTPLDRYHIQETMQSNLLKTLAFANGLLDVIIVGDNGMTYSAIGGASIVQALGSIPAGNSVPKFSNVLPYESAPSGYAQDSILVYGDVTSIQQHAAYGRHLGRVALVVSTDAIVPYDSVSSSDISSRYYLLDRGGRLISPKSIVQPAFSLSDYLNRSPAVPGDYRVRHDRQWYLVRVGGVSYLHGQIIGITPEAEIVSDVAHVRNMLMVISLAALSLLAMAFLFVARAILAPVRSLTDFIQRVKSSDPLSISERLSISGCLEIVEMGREFNTMLDELRAMARRLLDTTTRLYSAQLSRKQSQLSMLQSQINPHFLYNTLEAVNGMALAAGAAHIVDMTRALSHVFKYAVKASDMVTLGDEIGMLAAYLRIQQLRFGDRFRVEHEIDPETTTATIPKMTLQPIVENAISYGLESRRCGGVVSIRSCLKGDGTLQISVSDNGCGIDAHTLARLNQDLAATDSVSLVASDESRPIGIRNVQSRIKLAFGDRYGMDVESIEGTGTTVTFTLPSGASGNV